MSVYGENLADVQITQLEVNSKKTLQHKKLFSFHEDTKETEMFSVCKPQTSSLRIQRCNSKQSQ